MKGSGSRGVGTPRFLCTGSSRTGRQPWGGSGVALIGLDVAQVIVGDHFFPAFLVGFDRNAAAPSPKPRRKLSLLTRRASSPRARFQKASAISPLSESSPGSKTLITNCSSAERN